MNKNNCRNCAHLKSTNIAYVVQCDKTDKCNITDANFPYKRTCCKFFQNADFDKIVRAEHRKEFIQDVFRIIKEQVWLSFDIGEFYPADLLFRIEKRLNEFVENEHE